MKTMFELCEELRQAEVARRIGENKATINRCFHLDGPVNERILVKMQAVFGDEFDRDRTVIEWLDRRKDVAEAEAIRHLTAARESCPPGTEEWEEANAVLYRVMLGMAPPVIEEPERVEPDPEVEALREMLAELERRLAEVRARVEGEPADAA